MRNKEVLKITRRIREYSKEFKTEEINAALNSENISDIAAELGIPSATLHTWVSNASKAGHGISSDYSGDIKKVNINNLIDEIKDLKKRLHKSE